MVVAGTQDGGISLSYKKLSLIVVISGVILAIPTARIGFLMDDYIHLSLLEGWYGFTATPFNLYSFFHELPINPWWSSTDFKVSFWRPLSSALVWLDHSIFERKAVFYHVHSIFWLMCLLGALRLLYSHFLPGRLGVLALLVFALDECHTLTTAWIANRHSMVAMIPALLGFYAHLRWREKEWAWGLPLSILGYTVGLLGGETALGVLAYVLAYEIWSGDRMPKKILGVIPAAGIALIYILYYRQGGYGTSGAGFYLDPVGQPIDFMFEAILRIPALFAGMLLGLPVDLWLFKPALQPLQIASGAAAILIVFAILLTNRHRLTGSHYRTLRMMITGCLFSMFPVTAALPSDRLLITPMIGGAILVAFIIDTFLQWWRESQSSRGMKILRFCLPVLFVLVHLVFVPLGRYVTLGIMERQWENLRGIAEGVDLQDEEPEISKHYVLLTAPDVFMATYIPMLWIYDQRYVVESWHVLSLAPYDHVVSRPDSNTVEMMIVGGQLFSSDYEQFVRSPNDDIFVGDTVEADLFRVRILEVDDKGPIRVAFHFYDDIDLLDVVFLFWDGGSLRETSLTIDGDSMALPYMPGAVQF